MASIAGEQSWVTKETGLSIHGNKDEPKGLDLVWMNLHELFFSVYLYSLVKFETRPSAWKKRVLGAGGTGPG